MSLFTFLAKAFCGYINKSATLFNMPLLKFGIKVREIEKPFTNLLGLTLAMLESNYFIRCMHLQKTACKDALLYDPYQLVNVDLNSTTTIPY